MELFVYYILPNIALFGSIFVISKAVEKSVWWMIENWDELQKMLIETKDNT